MLMLKHTEPIRFVDVAAACKLQGCHDSHNLVQTIPGQKMAFACEGSHRQQTLRLSPEGVRMAQNLVAELRLAKDENEH
jgi:hypothetical protein